MKPQHVIPNISDERIAAATAAPLVVFDGVCVLCSGFVRTVIRLDRAQQFRFMTAQSETGQELLARHGLRTDEYDSNLVIINGVAYTHMDSVLAVARQIGWPWRAVSAMRLLPAGWRRRLYDLIARNRYAIFGRKDRCDVPSAASRARFID